MDDDCDFEGPTFSLGIDLDEDGRNGGCGSMFKPDLLAEDSDPDPAERAFKRLRRGVSATSSAPLPKADPQPSFAGICDYDDEEIEDYSSQEDPALGKLASAQYQPMCSTSKTPLSAQGSVVVISITKLQSNYRNQASHSQTNPRRESYGDKTKLPKLTVSPRRKFQLVDSDSEDFIDNHEVHISSAEKDIFLKNVKTSCGRTEPPDKRSVKESSTGSYQNHDLWKDFCSPKSFNMSTPVLDEVCEDCFQALKEQNDGKFPEHAACISNNERFYGKLTSVQNEPSLHCSLTPAHYYFLHNDMRIQNLVRRRLCNFYSVEILDNRGDDQPGVPNIAYRSQFSHGGTSTSAKQPNQKSNATSSSQKGCRKKKSMVEKVSQVSGSWVNPRVSVSVPNVAGQRRVQAGGSSDGGFPKKASSTGSWFKGSDGNRVYVSTSGQELTGKLAYLHYKKESGGGFRKSRKKSAARKK